jgi:hypothetical protein
MANERLLAAMARVDVSVPQLATLTGRDPKTVSRWLGGRVPHPRQRFLVAKHLGEDEEYLWPGARRAADNAAPGEIVATYPYRSNFSTESWWQLIDAATKQIDLLGYTLYFLPLDHPRLIPALIEKCRAGCRVRAVIANPQSEHVARRDAEEDQPITLVARISTSLKYFRELHELNNFEMRYQDLPLYNSLFRFDDQMLVTPHLHATPGTSAPMLRLRRLGPAGMFSRFAGHFESVWATTTAIPDSDWG